MDAEPKFKVATAYTLSQYRDYNRTVQRSNGVYRRVWGSLALYLAIGIALALLLSSWPAIPIFTAFGLVNVWFNFRNLRKAEDAQYQQEQLVGTIVYEFYDDRLDVTTSTGTTSNPYASGLKVIETDRSFFVMFAPTSGAILPKEDCPPDLDAFLHGRFQVTRARPSRSL